jgi:hypothetical protein
VNERGKVFDVHGGQDLENRNIIAWNRHKGLNQQWDVIYADQWPAEPKAGELNKDFGFRVDRTFYIVSEMKAHRYLDMLDNRRIGIKTRANRKSQQWYFHQPSETVRNRKNNQSFDIKNSGKSNDFQVWSTNSGWW